MGRILDGIVFVLYPLIVYFGLSRLGIRTTALILLVLTGRRFIFALLKNRETSRLVILQASAMTAIIGTAWALRSEFALRVTPFIVSLTFIAMFAASLKSVPFIERFARLQKPDLPESHVVYCRTLTKVWVLILSLNSILLLVASMIEDEGIWTVIVGPVSYGFLGITFVTEYVYRKHRFQEFDGHIVDRVLKKMVGRQGAR